MEKKPIIPKALKSFLKILITAILGQFATMLVITYLDNNNIFEWDEGVWKAIIGSSVGAGILVLKNWKDPGFPLYGKKPKEEIVIDNPAVPDNHE